MFVLLKAHFSSYVHVRPASIGRVENCWSNLNIIIQTWLLVWIIKSLDNWKFEYLWHFSSQYSYCFLHTIVQYSWEVSFGIQLDALHCLRCNYPYYCFVFKGKTMNKNPLLTVSRGFFLAWLLALIFKGVRMVCQSHSWFVSIHLEWNLCSGRLWFLLSICIPDC